MRKYSKEQILRMLIVTFILLFLISFYTLNNCDRCGVFRNGKERFCSWCGWEHGAGEPAADYYNPDGLVECPSCGETWNVINSSKTGPFCRKCGSLSTWKGIENYLKEG